MVERDNFSAFDDDLDPNPMGAVLPKKEPQTEAPDEVKQLREEVQRANDLRDEAIRGMLAGNQQSAQVVAPVEENKTDDDFIREHLPDDADDDVVALLAPVLRAHKELIERDVAERFGPVAETVERQENLNVLRERVPGFDETMLPEIKKLYDELPPGVREEYDTRTGVEALARRVLESKRGRADMSGMAHSEHPASPPMRDPGAGPSEADVWALSDDDFEKMVDKIKFGTPSR